MDYIKVILVCVALNGVSSTSFAMKKRAKKDSPRRAQSLPAGMKLGSNPLPARAKSLSQPIPIDSLARSTSQELAVKYNSFELYQLSEALEKHISQTEETSDMEGWKEGNMAKMKVEQALYEDSK